MLNNLKKYKVILASGSPRRRELLSGLGIDYTIKVLPDVNEAYPETLKGEDIPLYIAREKAEAYLKGIESDELIITADTIVWLDNEVLGKPTDEQQAKVMLRMLSGKTHHVITGVCLTTSEFQKSFTTTTEVTFAKLSEEEIDYYVEKYRPLDKAGAYGIQGKFAAYIKGIEGDYNNVVGLPVARLVHELKTF